MVCLCTTGLQLLSELLANSVIDQAVKAVVSNLLAQMQSHPTWEIIAHVINSSVQLLRHSNQQRQYG